MSEKSTNTEKYNQLAEKYPRHIDGWRYDEEGKRFLLDGDGNILYPVGGPLICFNELY